MKGHYLSSEYLQKMNSKSPVAIFMAATAAVIATQSLQPDRVHAGGGIGGLKEWTTDQEVDAESALDEDAKAAAKKAKEEDICIPIGEGENCW